MRSHFFALACTLQLASSTLYGMTKQSPPPCSPAPCSPAPCNPAPCPPCRCVNYPDEGLCNVPPAYNFSAAIDTSCSARLFGEVSFIYWYVTESYLDIGRSANFHEDGSTPASNATLAVPHFNYEPGFQLKVGYTSNYDGWEVGAQFTYLHQKTSFHVGAVPTAMVDGQEIWIPNEWFLNLSTDTQQQAVQMSSTWKMNLDFLDVLLSRPFYEGTQLSWSPAVGLRALWLDQSVAVNAVLATALTAPPATSFTQSDGWAIGPVAAANSHWLLGRGFRAEVDLGVSLLYMQYSNLKHNESFDFAVTETLPVSGHAPNEGSLRPTLEASLGLGWGSYLYQNRYHLDFSASYDFFLLWEQNKPREIVGYFANNEVGYSNPIGDLSLHGLTLTGRFDF